MNLSRLTRTCVVLDVDETLLAEMSPLQAETLRRISARFFPARGGVRWRGAVYTHPVYLYDALQEQAAVHDRRAEDAGETATGRWHADQAAFYRAVAKVIVARPFLRRYWPILAEQIDDVHEAAKREGKRGVAHEGKVWAA